MIPKLFHYFTSTFFRTSKIPWCLHVPQGWTHPSPSPWWRRVFSAFLVMFNPFSRHLVKETWVNDWRRQQMFINGCLKHTTDVFVDVLCLKGIPVYLRFTIAGDKDLAVWVLYRGNDAEYKAALQDVRRLLQDYLGEAESSSWPWGFLLKPRDVCLETDITQKDVALEHADFHSDIRHMCNQAG